MSDERTCEFCRYEHKAAEEPPCSDCICNRKARDNFEPKRKLVKFEFDMDEYDMTSIGDCTHCPLKLEDAEYVKIFFDMKPCNSFECLLVEVEE